MEFNTLVKNIESTHSAFFKQTANAVNINLSLRNWFIGFYIIEFEQNGKDKAEYGKQLLQTLAEKLNKKGFSYRNLNLFRKFYLTYPGIMQSLTAQSDLNQFSILQLATAELEEKLQLNKNQLNLIRHFQK